MNARDVLAQLRLPSGELWVDVAAQFQVDDVAAVLEGEWPYNFLTRARGASKTSDLAAVALAFLLASEHAGRFYWLAADSDQGTLAIDAIAGYLSRSPDSPAAWNCKPAVSSSRRPGPGSTSCRPTHRAPGGSPPMPSSSTSLRTGMTARLPGDSGRPASSAVHQAQRRPADRPDHRRLPGPLRAQGPGPRPDLAPLARQRGPRPCSLGRPRPNRGAAAASPRQRLSPALPERMGGLRGRVPRPRDDRRRLCPRRPLDGAVGQQLPSGPRPGRRQ